MSNSEIRRALNEERRKRFLQTLIQEATINVLAEQAAGQSPVPPATVAPAPAASPEAAPPPAAPPPEVPQQPAQFTVDDMIERLNVIRGGRSFTDPEVYGQLVSFFKTLDDTKKDNLKSFLVELGKIVIDVNQEEPNATQQPAQPPGQQPPPPAAPAAPPPPAAGGGAPPIAAA